MKGRRSRFTLVALLVLAQSLVVLAPSTQASGEDRLSRIRRELRAARSNYAKLNATDKQLRAAMAQVSSQLGAAQSLLGQAQTRLAAIQARIDASERRLAALEARKRANSAMLDARVRELYMMGPGIQTDALLGSGNLEEFLERSSAFEFVLRNDRLTLENLARLADETSKTRRALAEQAASAAAWRKTAADRVALVAEALSAKQAAEQVLSARMADELREIRGLEAEQNRIVALIRSRTSYYSGRVSMKGFSWPTTSHHINSDYGPRWGGFHTGIDLQCAQGTPDYAAKAGTVIAAEWGGGYGNMIIIDHGNGVTSLYGHHSRLYVSEGQRVARGQRIAACGSTGNSTGAHLHFEIRINGDHVNPRPYLP